MPISQRSSTYHARFCALRNWKIALTYFLFCALQVVLRWREFGNSPQGQQQSIIFYVAAVAVIAALGDLAMALKCFRERVVLILVIISFTFTLVKAFWRTHIAAVAVTSERALMILWIVASAMSLSMVVSALRRPGGLE